MNIIKILKTLNEPNVNKEFFNLKNNKNKNKNIKEDDLHEMVKKYKKDKIKYLKIIKLEDSKKMFNFVNMKYNENNPIVNNELYDILKFFINNKGNRYDNLLTDIFLNNYKNK